MTYPEVPLPAILTIPFIFLAMILVTDIRYHFNPSAYLVHSTTIAALAIGFIFLYALQKYDGMDSNFPIVVRNIIFLSDIALQYDPTLICYLLQYLEDFQNFDNTGYPIVTFEEKLLPLIDDKNLIFRIREAVTTLEDSAYERISEVNLIPNPIWYVVFVAAIVVSIIFPLDLNLNKTDAVLAVILIWFPVVVIYSTYLTILNDLDDAIEETTVAIEKLVKTEKINCCKVTGDDNTNTANIPIRRRRF